MIFVANKYDLILDAQFDFKEVQQISKEYDSHSYVSSAKTGENVENLFNTLAAALLEIRVKS